MLLAGSCCYIVWRCFVCCVYENASSIDCSIAYAVQEKGRFQHSSFLAGGAVGAAGQIAVDRGRIVRMAPMSGQLL